MERRSFSKWDFDVDIYLNRFVPRNRIYRLPTPIAWFLGYRESPREKLGSVLIWWWAFFGAFAGLLVVESVFQTKALKAEGTPMVIASFGAAAILEYHIIDSPLSQPRNAILGQLLSAFIGISISKLFQLTPSFPSYRWLSGALSVGIASAAMGVTKTVHPPAGATALLCSSEAALVALGWDLLWMVGLGSCLMVGVALVVNNLQRTWPVYWWTAADLNTRKKEVEKKKDDLENGSRQEVERNREGRILVDCDRIVVPEWLDLEFEEKALLEMMSARLREGKGRESESTHTGRSPSEAEVRS